jgi:hypothetical protein
MLHRKLWLQAHIAFAYTGYCPFEWFDQPAEHVSPDKKTKYRLIL